MINENLSLERIIKYYCSSIISFCEKCDQSIKIEIRCENQGDNLEFDIEEYTCQKCGYHFYQEKLNDNQIKC